MLPDLGFGRRLPMVLQTEGAECGLACLAMLAGYHGPPTDAATLRREQGFSLKGGLAQGSDPGRRSAGLRLPAAQARARRTGGAENALHPALGSQPFRRPAGDRPGRGGDPRSGRGGAAAEHGPGVQAFHRGGAGAHAEGRLRDHGPAAPGRVQEPARPAGGREAGARAASRPGPGARALRHGEPAVHGSGDRPCAGRRRSRPPG